MSFPLLTEDWFPPVPGRGHTLVNVCFEEYVGKVADFVWSALFAATTYSTLLPAEIRLNA